MLSYALVWLAIWSTALYVIGVLLAKHLVRRWVKVVLLPAFTIDATFRILACLVTATKIKGFHPLTESKPFLEIDRPPIRHIGPALFICCRLALLLTGLVVGLNATTLISESGFYLPLIDERTVSTGRLDTGSWRVSWENLLELPTAFVDLNPLLFIGLIYVATGVLLAAALTFREYVAALYALIAFQMVILVLSWLGAGWGFLSRAWFIQKFYVPSFWAVFSVIVLYTIVLSSTIALVRLIVQIVAHRQKPNTDRA
ncbi:MAG: hypothetical protein ACKVX7_03690 [Planctomycetota bacterium]